MQIYIIEKKFKGNAMTPGTFMDCIEWTFHYWSSTEPSSKDLKSDERYHYRSTPVKELETVRNAQMYEMENYNLIHNFPLGFDPYDKNGR